MRTSNSNVIDREVLLPRLWNSFRRLQQLNRQSGSGVTPSLALREAFVLLYLDAHPLCPIAPMRRFHRFHQSVGSVLITELSKKGLVRYLKSSTDARERSIQLTARGVQYLKAFDKVQNKKVLDNVKTLSHSQINKLTVYFSRLADALGVDPQRPRKKEIPFRVETRRVFIALGFLQNDFASSGLTLLQYQLLSELKFHPHISTAASIGRRIGADPKGVVFHVRALKKKSLITSAENQTDKRKKSLQLTQKGVSLVNLVQLRIQAILRSGVSDLSDRELLEFTELLEQGTETGMFSPDLAEITIREARTPQDYYAVRAFVVEELVRQKLHFELPETILPPSHRVIYSMRKKRIVAVAEYRLDSKKWKLARLLADSSEEERLPEYQFLDRAAALAHR